jgi:hypothetical protein
LQLLFLQKIKPPYEKASTSDWWSGIYRLSPL